MSANTTTPSSPTGKPLTAFFTLHNEALSNLVKSSCDTIQSLDYTCTRNRDEAGTPYGPPQFTELTFSLRASITNYKSTFYKLLDSHEAGNFTFLFNADFTPKTRKLDKYEGGFVVQGYIINIDEEYETSSKDGTFEQLLLHITLLVNAITYLGNDESVKTLDILK